ncbi:MAG: DUF3604 domain-containing protein, partial [Gammaproteobacteria bacterium]|nr:DUF3604 domain-containing protein [Gammaproteobacteria bacterium]
FPDGTAMAADVDTLGRAHGVPMGGDLPVAPEAGLAPEFIAVAQRDPLGANLDRIQMIKGWVDADGASHESIFDLAWSDDRDIDPDTGKLSPVGSTVNPQTATYTNQIGTPQLTAQWRDPDFDPGQETFYYLRVLEIPTPRWSTYDALQLGMEPMEPLAIQERAISSAIWYQP